MFLLLSMSRAGREPGAVCLFSAIVDGFLKICKAYLDRFLGENLKIIQGEGMTALSVTAVAVPAPPKGEPRTNLQDFAACLPLWGRCPVRTLGGEGRSPDLCAQHSLSAFFCQSLFLCGFHVYIIGNGFFRRVFFADFYSCKRTGLQATPPAAGRFRTPFSEIS